MDVNKMLVVICICTYVPILFNSLVATLYVTGFAKKGLIHASNFATLMCL